MSGPSWQSVCALVCVALIVLFAQSHRSGYVGESAATISQIGGRPASPGKWPFVCLIRGPLTGTGFLFDKQLVMTAAHVVRGAKAKDLVVYVGGNRSDGSDAEKHTVASMMVSSAKAQNRNYDWAILTLSKPSRKPPVKVDGYSADVLVRPGDKVWSAGFGMTSSTSPATSLQENVFSVTRDDGKVLVLSGAQKESGLLANRSIYHGDSGGPCWLMHGEEPIVVGLASGFNPSDTTSFVTRTRHIMIQYITGVKNWGCRFAGRVTRDNKQWRCPSSHPWDVGVSGKSGKLQCTTSARCAWNQNWVYRLGKAVVNPPRHI